MNVWPRTRDLPEIDRAIFEHWLSGQTRPLIEGEPWNEQDAYYEHDYERWKRQGKRLEQAYVDWD